MKMSIDTLRNINNLNCFQKGKEAVNLRNKLPEGTIIRLISMNEDPRPVLSGSYGVVKSIDDLCQIHMEWEDGSNLALVPGIDDFEVLGRCFFNYNEDEYWSEEDIRTLYKENQSEGLNKDDSLEDFINSLLTENTFDMCRTAKDIPVYLMEN